MRIADRLLKKGRSFKEDIRVRPDKLKRFGTEQLPQNENRRVSFCGSSLLCPPLLFHTDGRLKCVYCPLRCSRRTLTEYIGAV